MDVCPSNKCHVKVREKPAQLESRAGRYSPATALIYCVIRNRNCAVVESALNAHRFDRVLTFSGNFESFVLLTSDVDA